MKNKILTELPTKQGIGIYKNKIVIDRRSMKGMKLEVEYNGEKYSGIYVKDIISEGGRDYFILEYNDIENKVECGNFIAGKFASTLGFRNKNFKAEIGENLNDNNRDMVIIDRDLRKNKKESNGRHKYYKYKCNKCNNEEWISESALLVKKVGCNACCEFNKKPKLGINTIWDTHKWLVDDFGLDEEFAKNNVVKCLKKGKFICKDCGSVRYRKCLNVLQTYSIACDCSDGKSYISKSIYNVLKQLNVKFNTEVKYEWNKYTNPLTNKKSQASIDFIIYKDDREIPLEADGGFHRKDNNMNGMTAEMYQEIDRQRDENCLKYLGEETIRISDEGDIKENILNSKLAVEFNLSKIDWLENGKFALSNLAKEVCEHWNNKQEWETTKDLAEMFSLNRYTIMNYLKRGSSLGWCDYNAQSELEKGRRKNGRSKIV